MLAHLLNASNHSTNQIINQSMLNCLLCLENSFVFGSFIFRLLSCWLVQWPQLFYKSMLTLLKSEKQVNNKSTEPPRTMPRAHSVACCIKQALWDPKKLSYPAFIYIFFHWASNLTFMYICRGRSFFGPPQNLWAQSQLTHQTDIMSEPQNQLSLISELHAYLVT